MRDFILFMHDDTLTAPAPEAWPAYFAELRRLGAFEGGSAIGAGNSFRKQQPPGAVHGRLAGFIRVRAESPAEARKLLAGNPVYESGGTVEIRELPRD